MKKTILILALMSFLLLPLVSAQCTINGQPAPCEEVFGIFKTLAWLFVPLLIVAVIAGLFTLWMLIDCIKRDFDNKVLWVILILFLNVLGAILYYFMVKRPDL